MIIWVLDKKVVKHLAETPRGLLEIPIRVSFEYAVEQETFVAGSMTRKVLYNRDYVLRHVPADSQQIEADINATVDDALTEHLRFVGHLHAATPLYPELEAEEAAPVQVRNILLTPKG